MKGILILLLWLLVLSFSYVGGFSIILGISIVFMRFYPVIAAIFYLAAPVPQLIQYHVFVALQRSDEMEIFFHDISLFLTSFLLSTGLLLPIVFFHVGLIGWIETPITMIGGVVIFTAAFVYLQCVPYLNANQEPDIMELDFDEEEYQKRNIFQRYLHGTLRYFREREVESF